MGRAASRLASARREIDGKHQLALTQALHGLDESPVGPAELDGDLGEAQGAPHLDDGPGLTQEDRLAGDEQTVLEPARSRSRRGSAWPGA